MNICSRCFIVCVVLLTLSTNLNAINWTKDSISIEFGSPSGEYVKGSGDSDTETLGSKQYGYKIDGDEIWVYKYPYSYGEFASRGYNTTEIVFKRNKVIFMSHSVDMMGVINRNYTTARETFSSIGTEYFGYKAPTIEKNNCYLIWENKTHVFIMEPVSSTIAEEYLNKTTWHEIPVRRYTLIDKRLCPSVADSSPSEPKSSGW